jgi:sec-independent protein translocase protein TatA
MGEFSIYHWLIVLLIVVLFFGGRRIPEVMKGFGEGIRAFKTGLQGKVSTRDTQHETQGKSTD